MPPHPVRCPATACVRREPLKGSLHAVRAHLMARHAEGLWDFSCPICPHEKIGVRHSAFFNSHFALAHLDAVARIELSDDEGLLQDEEDDGKGTSVSAQETASDYGTDGGSFGYAADRSWEEEPRADHGDEVLDFDQGEGVVLDLDQGADAVLDLDLGIDGEMIGTVAPDAEPGEGAVDDEELLDARQRTPEVDVVTAVQDLLGGLGDIDHVVPYNMDLPPEEVENPEDRRRLAIVAFIIDHQLSHKSYTDLTVLLRLLGLNTEEYDVQFRTLRDRAMRQTFDEMFEMSTPVKVDGNRLPIVNICPIVKFWFGHPVLERTVRSTGVSALWSAPRWIKTYLGQEDKWRPAYDAAVHAGKKGELCSGLWKADTDTDKKKPALALLMRGLSRLDPDTQGSRWLKRPCNTTAFLCYISAILPLPVVPIHLLVFVDDFDIEVNRDRNYGVMAVSLGNLHHGLRSVVDSPAVLPAILWDRNMKRDVGSDALASYTGRQLIHLARGVNVWSAVERKPVLVIALVHLIKGDGPGRAAFTGFKRFTMNAARPCHGCLISRDEIPLRIANGEGLQLLYRGKETADCFQRLGEITPDDPHFEVMGRVYGVAHRPGVLDWPIELIPAVAFDASHMVEGEVPKFLFYTTCIISKYHRSFWKDFAAAYARYCSQNHLSSAGLFASYTEWANNLNMQAKLNCALASPVLFEDPTVCPVAIRQAFLEHLTVWEEFVAFWRVISQHRISAEELRRLRRIADVYRRFAALYPEEVNHFTINSHYVMHLPDYVEEVGVPRDYWVLTNEREIGRYKWLAELSNHKSKMFSVMRNLLAARSMHAVLDPDRGVPRNFNYLAPRLGEVAVSGELRLSLRRIGIHVPDGVNIIDEIPRATVNYLLVYKSSFVQVLGGRIGLVQHILRINVGLDDEEPDYRACISAQSCVPAGEDALLVTADMFMSSAGDICLRFEGMASPGGLRVMRKIESISIV